MKTGQLLHALARFAEEWIPAPLYARLAALDPKLVAALVASALTYVVVQLLGLDLDEVLLTVGTVQVTWAYLIAGVAAAVAGWYKSNEASINRVEQDDGNAEPPPDHPPLSSIEDELPQPTDLDVERPEPDEARP